MSSTEQTLPGITPATTPAPTSTGLIAHSPSLCPTKHVVQTGHWRWRWWCIDDATGEVLKSGHRPTETRAWTRAEAVANRIHDERLEAERRAMHQRDAAAKRLHDERLEAE